MASRSAAEMQSTSRPRAIWRVTFAVEPWEVLWRDGQQIFPVHYDELALHKDRIPLGMDDSLYRQIESLGRLHIVTARLGRELIGYYISIIIPNHPHNKDAGPASTCDMFYILPDHRKGGTGAKLLMFAEDSLRARGVVKASMSTKLKFQSRELLEALGWEATDLVFQKIL